MCGAGGTEGGIGRFFIGLLMLIAGGYLFLQSVMVRSSFTLGYGIYTMYNVRLTSGVVMIPFMFGVGLIFYDAKNIPGWVLFIGSLALLVFGVISSIHFSFRSMTAFDLIVILVLLCGGLGMFLSSLRTL
jgi:hypothetical protein